jgi:uncharacterized protein (TIGR02246 family)
MPASEMNMKLALSTPEDIHCQFQEAINSGNLRGLLGLYEKDASLILSDGQILSGLQAIENHFAGLLQMRPTMKIQRPTVILNEGLAVLLADWRLSGTSPSGESFDEQCRTYDVVRKQSDGTWRIVFDSPWGARRA